MEKDNRQPKTRTEPTEYERLTYEILNLLHGQSYYLAENVIEHVKSLLKTSSFVKRQELTSLII